METYFKKNKTDLTNFSKYELYFRSNNSMYSKQHWNNDLKELIEWLNEDFIYTKNQLKFLTDEWFKIEK
jgi:hypothetical protein